MYDCARPDLVQLLDCSHHLMFLLIVSNGYILRPTNLISPKVIPFSYIALYAYRLAHMT